MVRPTLEWSRARTPWKLSSSVTGGRHSFEGTVQDLTIAGLKVLPMPNECFVATSFDAFDGLPLSPMESRRGVDVLPNDNAHEAFGV